MTYRDLVSAQVALQRARTNLALGRPITVPESAQTISTTDQGLLASGFTVPQYEGEIDQASVIRLSTGEYVDRQWVEQNLTPAQQQQLADLGITGFNQAQQAKYERITAAQNTVQQYGGDVYRAVASGVKRETLEDAGYAASDIDMVYNDIAEMTPGQLYALRQGGVAALKDYQPAMATSAAAAAQTTSLTDDDPRIAQLRTRAMEIAEAAAAAEYNRPDTLESLKELVTQFPPAVQENVAGMLAAAQEEGSLDETVSRLNRDLGSQRVRSRVIVETKAVAAEMEIPLSEINDSINRYGELVRESVEAQKPAVKAEMNRAAEELAAFEASTIKLSTGEYVSKADVAGWTPDQLAQLQEMGLEAYNASQAAIGAAQSRVTEFGGDVIGAIARGIPRDVLEQAGYDPADLDEVYEAFKTMTPGELNAARGGAESLKAYQTQMGGVEYFPDSGQGPSEAIVTTPDQGPIIVSPETAPVVDYATEGQYGGAAPIAEPLPRDFNQVLLDLQDKPGDAKFQQLQAWGLIPQDATYSGVNDAGDVLYTLPPQYESISPDEVVSKYNEIYAPAFTPPGTPPPMSLVDAAPAEQFKQAQTLGLVPKGSYFVGASESGNLQYVVNRYDAMTTDELLSEYADRVGGSPAVPTSPGVTPTREQQAQVARQALEKLDSGGFAWGEFGLGLIPIYGTVRNWNKMELPGQMLSLIGEAAFIGGLLGPSIRGIKAVAAVPKAVPVSTAVRRANAYVAQIFEKTGLADTRLAAAAQDVVENSIYHLDALQRLWKLEDDLVTAASKPVGETKNLGQTIARRNSAIDSITKWEQQIKASVANYENVALQPGIIRGEGQDLASILRPGQLANRIIDQNRNAALAIDANLAARTVTEGNKLKTVIADIRRATTQPMSEESQAQRLIGLYDKVADSTNQIRNSLQANQQTIDALRARAAQLEAALKYVGGTEAESIRGELAFLKSTPTQNTINQRIALLQTKLKYTAPLNKPRLQNELDFLNTKPSINAIKERIKSLEDTLITTGAKEEQSIRNQIAYLKNQQYRLKGLNEESLNNLIRANDDALRLGYGPDSFDAQTAYNRAYAANQSLKSIRQDLSRRQTVIYPEPPSIYTGKGGLGLGLRLKLPKNPTASDIVDAIEEAQGKTVIGRIVPKVGAVDMAKVGAGLASVAIPTAVPTPTGVPTPAGTPAAVPTPTGAPMPAGTPAAVPTPIGVPTPAGTPAAVPTPIGVPTPAGTPAAVPTPTGAPTLAGTPTAVPTPTSVPTPVPIGVPTPTPTPTPMPTPVPVPTPAPTPTPSPTSTNVAREYPYSGSSIGPSGDDDDKSRPGRRRGRQAGAVPYPDTIALRAGFGFRTIDMDTGEARFTLEPPPNMRSIEGGPGSASRTFTILSEDYDPPSQRDLDIGIMKMTVGRQGVKFRRKSAGRRRRKRS